MVGILERYHRSISAMTMALVESPLGSCNNTLDPTGASSQQAHSNSFRRSDRKPKAPWRGASTRI